MCTLCSRPLGHSAFDFEGSWPLWLLSGSSKNIAHAEPHDGCPCFNLEAMQTQQAKRQDAGACECAPGLNWLNAGKVLMATTFTLANSASF